MTHAERLREIADWLTKRAPYCGEACRANSDSIRAAADWMERVPHSVDCGRNRDCFRNERTGEWRYTRACDCHHAEQAP